jgi:modulator of FtsH protease
VTVDEIAAWSDFAVGLAGAAAALTGLLFVAVSINIERVVVLPTLARLAASTLTLFAMLLVGALVILVPGQSPTALGVELLVLGVGAGTPLVIAQLRRPRRSPQTSRLDWAVTRLAPAVVVPALTAMAGLAALSTAPGGLLWFAGAAVVALIAGLIGAWILLVEILR